jgi:hypothetical protein
MLTRFSSAIAIAVLVTGTGLTLGAAPALAAGPCGGTPGSACSGTHYTRPGRTVPVRRGGGGGRKAAPMPCPAAVNCNTAVLGDPAPPQRIPTIDIAYRARNQLKLPAPHVHTSPAGKTYVQLQTGLWVLPGDFARKTAAAPVPGQVVTAIGTPKDVTWNMGESTVTCQTAGRRNGTDCSYTYKRSSAGQPDGKYAISVTVTWNVYWTCEGDCDADAAQGTYAVPTMSMTTNTTLAVGEVQTESRPG